MTMWPQGVHLLLALVSVPTFADNSQDTVNLQYDWRSGTEARVEFSMERTRDPAGPADNIQMSGSSLLSTRAHKAGLEISFRDVKVDVETDDSSPADFTKKFMGRLAAMSPSYVVGADGMVVDIVNFNEIQARIQQSFDHMKKSATDQTRPGSFVPFDHLMKTATSREALLTLVESRWMRNVGQWIGREMEHGKALTVELKVPSPLISSAQFPVEISYYYDGQTVCGESDSERTCVILRMVCTHVPEALAAVGGFSAQMTTEVEVVTEPDTLLPHSVRHVETIVLTDPDGEPQEIVQRRSYRYIYIER